MRRRDFLALAGAAAAFPRIALAQQTQPVLNVGFSYSSPSWSWFDVVSGINNGFMLDLAAALGKDMGVAISFRGAFAGDLPDLLAARKIDFISTVFIPAYDPQGLVDYSINVWNYGEALMVKKTDRTDYKSLQDLKGKRVSPGAFAPQLMASGIPMTVIQPTLSTVDTIEGMRNGTVDLGTFTTATVSYIANSGDYPDITIAKNYVPSFLNQTRLAVRKGNATLLNKLNASLKKLMADGTMKAIWAKYNIDWKPPV